MRETKLRGRIPDIGSDRHVVVTQVALRRTTKSRAAHILPGALSQHERADKLKLAWPARILLISLFLPWAGHIGPLALSPHRVVLVTMVVPCLFLWITGKAGRIRAADVTLLLYCIWCAISLIVNHGVEGGIEPSGILVIETAGAYFIARCYIRDQDSFREAIRLLFIMVAALFPFAVLEAVVQRNVLLDVFSNLFPVIPTAASEARWGLRRVQGPLEHPILFGVVCGSILGLAHFVLGYREKTALRWLKTSLVGATAFLSLSAGPITALFAQVALVTWDRALQSYAYRWHLLGGLLSTMWLSLSAVANRSVPNLFLSYFAFDQHSAYFRILIWTYGTQSALNNPLFGVGLNRWERPSWMPASIDMFWLIHAVFYGIPAAILMLLTFLLPLLGVGLRKDLNEGLKQYRTGYLIAMCGFFLVGWTVHFWNSTYVLFLFLLASGLWILDADRAEPESNKAAPAMKPRLQPARVRAHGPGARVRRKTASVRPPRP